MRYSHLLFLLVALLLSCNSEEKVSYLSSEAMVMATPKLQCDNLFFTDSVEVSMSFSFPNATIKYTLDGSEATNQSKTYDQPIRLKENTTIKAKNFHPEFKSSASAILNVKQTNTKLRESTITLTPPPSERYKGGGGSTLIDHKKGTNSFASGDAWLGFQADSVTITINLPNAQRISKVTLSTMANHSAWIFSPKSIAIFAGIRSVGKKEVQAPSEGDISRQEFIEIPVEENTYDELKIVIVSLNEIPEWHQGKGTLPWFFTDEILVE